MLKLRKSRVFEFFFSLSFISLNEHQKKYIMYFQNTPQGKMPLWGSFQSEIHELWSHTERQKYISKTVFNYSAVIKNFASWHFHFRKSTFFPSHYTLMLSGRSIWCFHSCHDHNSPQLLWIICSKYDLLFHMVVLLMWWLITLVHMTCTNQQIMQAYRNSVVKSL